MKRFIGLFILTVLSLSFISCSAEEPETVPDYGDFSFDSENINMNGYECIFHQEANADRVSNADGTATAFFYEPNSYYCDIMLQREKDIEEKYNCEITFQNGTALYVQRAVVSNLNLVNLVSCSYSNVNFQYAKAGYFYPLTEVSNIIDLGNTEKYGSAYVLETCMFNGIPYGVASLYLPNSMPDLCLFVMYINEDIISSNGYTDPRDFYEQKTWTWDTLDKITDEWFISEGDKTIYSITSNYSLLNIFLNGAGITMVYEDNGTVKPGFMKPQAISAIDRAKKFETEHKSQIRINADSLQYFLDNNAVMTYRDTFYLNEISAKVNNFGIVPVPADGTTTQNGEEMQGFATLNTISIVANTPEPELDARILSDLLEPMPGCETKEEMVDFLYKTLFFDKRDAEVYLDLFNHCYYSYYATMQTKTENVSSLYEKGKSGIEIVEALEHYIDSEIETVMGPNYYYIKEHTNN